MAARRANRVSPLGKGLAMFVTALLFVMWCDAAASTRLRINMFVPHFHNERDLEATVSTHVFRADTPSLLSITVLNMGTANTNQFSLWCTQAKCVSCVEFDNTAKGGSALPAVFEKVDALSEPGTLTLLVDSDAMMLAQGWDTILVGLFETDPALAVAGINPRGNSTRGDRSAFLNVAEWNWMAYRTDSFKGLVTAKGLNTFLAVSRKQHGQEKDWGHYFSEHARGRGLGVHLWPGTRVLRHKECVVSRDPHDASFWVLHLFFGSRTKNDEIATQEQTTILRSWQREAAVQWALRPSNGAAPVVQAPLLSNVDVVRPTRPFFFHSPRSAPASFRHHLLRWACPGLAVDATGSVDDLRAAANAAGCRTRPAETETQTQEQGRAQAQAQAQGQGQANHEGTEGQGQEWQVQRQQHQQEQRRRRDIRPPGTKPNTRSVPFDGAKRLRRAGEDETRAPDAPDVTRLLLAGSVPFDAAHDHGQAIGLFRHPHGVLLSQFRALPPTDPLAGNLAAYVRKYRTVGTVMGMVLGREVPAASASAAIMFSAAEVKEAAARVRTDFAFVGLAEQYHASVCVFHALVDARNPQPPPLLRVDDMEGVDKSSVDLHHKRAVDQQAFLETATAELVAAGYSDPYDEYIYSVARDVFAASLRRFPQCASQ
eukprot:m.16679 g.16679  ORF g.16679 m.16679 type:complete len:655 (+) comp5304_c0_seq2:84-2048(+)